MRTTNRMLPRSNSLAAKGETVVVGAGQDGVLNGGTSLVLCVDGTGLVDPITLRFYGRATPTSAWGAAFAVVVVAAGEVRNLNVEDLRGYDLRVTAAHPGAGAIAATFSHSIEAP